jgi:hypothetical protein
MHIYEEGCTAALTIAGKLKPSREFPLEELNQGAGFGGVEQIKGLLSKAVIKGCACSDCSGAQKQSFNCMVCGYQGEGHRRSCDEGCTLINYTIGKVIHNNTCNHYQLLCPFCYSTNPNELLKTIRQIIGL